MDISKVFLVLCLIATAQSLTKCEKERAEILGLNPIGTTDLDRPVCRADGHYAARQCVNWHRTCYCVRARSGRIKFNEIYFPDTENYDCKKRPTRCQKRRYANNTESWIAQTENSPECTADGKFEKIQCKNGDRVYCWCVNRRGKELKGTRADTKEEVNCDKKRSRCEKERNARLFNDPQWSGQIVPTCDPQGRFTPQQCFHGFGVGLPCWCVNTRTGVEIPNTRSDGSLQC